MAVIGEDLADVLCLAQATRRVTSATSARSPAAVTELCSPATLSLSQGVAGKFPERPGSHGCACLRGVCTRLLHHGAHAA